MRALIYAGNGLKIDNLATERQQIAKSRINKHGRDHAAWHVWQNIELCANAMPPYINVS